MLEATRCSELSFQSLKPDIEVIAQINKPSLRKTKWKKTKVSKELTESTGISSKEDLLENSWCGFFLHLNQAELNTPVNPREVI